MTVMSIARGLRSAAPAHRFASATLPADQGLADAFAAAAAAPAREAGTFRPRAGAGGKTFRVDAFAGVLARKTAAFTKELADIALADITLDMDAEGRVTAAGGHPGKAAVERLFAGNPDFANRYREVAGGHAFLAHCRVAARFQIELEDSRTEEERKAILRRYDSMFSRIDGVRGRMSWSGGRLASAAMEMAAGLL
ncbi:hypothetical protein [Roseomonas genomospecies 6]|uniref:Uncharacterized protein n=1 Tax=Roseomonas genomospecies 6 TaxID=214106 RepID=A0A9W7TYV6_9PROT|nr:hypothetical protein [Roseomonas genomospecies 6]KAA0681872.1 hypothetical protein DS843_08860 [Roseomonas genomospecies 6]